MTLTLRQAADKCGKSRSTIHRALKSGKLSGSRDDDGTWSIDAAELARVFPWDVREHDQRDATEQGRDSSAVFMVKIEMLEQQLEREQSTIEDLRKRLDRSEERVFLLSAPAHPPSVQNTAPQKGLWKRVRGLVYNDLDD